MSAESRKKAIQGMVQKNGGASPKARRRYTDAETAGYWAAQRLPNRRRGPVRTYPPRRPGGPEIRLT